MKWLCGLSYVVLTFFGALNMKRVLGFLFGVLATLWMAAPAAAWNTLNSSEEPGSALVFYKFETGTVGTIDQGILPVIEYRVSVVCPTNVDCSSLSGPVTIMGHWICKGDFTTHVCGDFNFEVQTTVNGSIVFDPQNTLSSTTPPPPGAVRINPPTCDAGEGYLIMWVESGPGGVPIKADVLVGTAVIHDSGSANFSTDARAFNAIPIQANPDLLFGSPIPLNSDGSLPFDGSGYQAVTGKIYGNVRYDTDSSKTELAFLTLDAIGGQANTPTDVFLNFYNENEVVRSMSNFQFTCWDDEALSGFGTLDATFGRHGVVASPQNSPGALQGGKAVTLMVIAETEEEYSQPISITGTLTGPVTLTGPGSLTGTATATATNTAAFLAAYCVVTVTPSSTKCAIPSTFTGPVTLTGVASIIGSLTDTLGLQRSYTYPLLNDSVPQPTSFLPH
jgi:hypothetical protein